MQENLEKIIKEFKSISLEEMDSVKLQDRADTKFVFNINKLAEILNEVKSEYRLLEINGLRFNHYETLYFDSHNLDLYTFHHNSKLNRYKVRFRNYVESKLYYFEIKFKNSKGRTIKHRQKINNLNALLGDEQNKKFANKHLPFNPDTLKPVVWVNYRRMTFVNLKSQERLTIDTELTFIHNDEKVVLGDLVIAELKQPKVSIHSPFYQVLKKHGIHPGSISKYCQGIIHMYPFVKKNNFKPQILTLKKILYAAA